MFSGPVERDNAQGEIISLVLVRETGSDGVETGAVWLDFVLSDFLILEGNEPLPQFGCSAEGLRWSAGVGRAAGGSEEDPKLGGEAQLALEIDGGERAEGFSPWPDGLYDALLDLSIRFERAGDGWKHFSGEEGMVL